MPRSEFTLSTSIWFACAISSRVFSIRSSMVIRALDTACFDILNKRAILILRKPLRLSLQNSNCLSFRGRNISQDKYVYYLKIIPFLIKQQLLLRPPSGSGTLHQTLSILEFHYWHPALPS